MPTIETLTVDIEARTSQFNSALRGAGVALGAFAAGATVAFKEYEEAQALERQTAAVLKSTGNAANVSADQISARAEALMELSGVDDDVIRQGQNMLLTFKNIRNEVGAGNDIFNQATDALLDMSAAMGTEPRQAAIQLGKALNDPIAGLSALSRVGIQFSESQEKQITAMTEAGDVMSAQKIILAELESQFGGSAAALATDSGKAATAFGELTEALGGVAAAGLTPLMQAAKPVLDFLARSPGLTAVLIGSITALVVAYKLWRAWTLLTATAQAVLLAAMPWALIAAAVIALVVVVVRNWDKIKSFVLGVWDKIMEKTKTARAVIVAVWNVLRDAAKRVWEGIKSAAIVAFDAIVRVFTNVINFVIRRLNEVIYAINLVKPGADIGYLSEIGGGATGGAVAGAASRVGQTVGNALNVTIRVDRKRFVDGMTRDAYYRGW